MKDMKMERELRKNWQTRILLTFGVNPLSCSKCEKQMRFNDIVYHGVSAIEILKKQILLSSEKKIEKFMYFQHYSKT